VLGDNDSFAAERHLDSFLVVTNRALDAQLLFQTQPPGNDDLFLDDRNDVDIAIQIRLDHLVDDPVDRHALDLDLLVTQ